MAEKYVPTDPTEKLKLMALAQVPIPYVVIDKNYKIVYTNIAGTRMVNVTSEEDYFGKDIAEFVIIPDCPLEQRPERQVMRSGESITIQTEVKKGDDEITVESTITPLRGDQGDVIGCMFHTVDVTEKVAALANIRKLQQDLIEELSMPVLTLWEGVLNVPLIGTLDSRRTQDAMEKALTRMAEDSAQVLIVDVTGVPVIDTMVANHLIRMATAVKLMGGDCIITGISPTTARTIVHLGIDLSAIKTRSTLAQGLKLAIELVEGRN